MKRAYKIAGMGVFILSLSACGSISTLTSSFWDDGSQKPAKLVKFDEESKVTRLWKSRTGHGTRKYYLRLNPAVADGRVYTADHKGEVIAYNSKSGRHAWEINLRTPITSGPVVRGGLVLLGTGQGEIIALNKQTGDTLWKKSVHNEVLAAPELANNKVIAKTVAGTVFALNAYTGEELWVYDHGAPSLQLRASSTVGIEDGRVVAGFADGKVTVLSLDTGKVLWTKTVAVPRGSAAVERMVDVDADPIIHQGIIYVASYQGNIAALTLSSGQLLWQHTLSAFAGMTIKGNRLFVSDAKSHVWAFNRNTGEVIWQQDKLDARAITAPVIMGKAIVVGDKKGYLHWIDREDGHFLARTRVNRTGIVAAPTVNDDTIFVTTQHGDIAAFKVQ